MNFCHLDRRMFVPVQDDGEPALNKTKTSATRKLGGGSPSQGKGKETQIRDSKWPRPSRPSSGEHTGLGEDQVAAGRPLAHGLLSYLPPRPFFLHIQLPSYTHSSSSATVLTLKVPVSNPRPSALFLGCCHKIYIKCNFRNVTGSFRDKPFQSCQCFFWYTANCIFLDCKIQQRNSTKSITSKLDTHTRC